MTLRRSRIRTTRCLRSSSSAPTEEVNFKSKDGTEVHGLLTKPVGYVAGTKVPLLLRIHGGPNGQDEHSFSTERQWFAANGYAVLAVNYRGSAGRGDEVLAGDLRRLGPLRSGGSAGRRRSRGQDGRRRSRSARRRRLELRRHPDRLPDRQRHALQGGDERRRHRVHRRVLRHRPVHHSVRLRDWSAVESEGWETYQKISYPFLHADRIKTPTLFLGGERDFNVPVQGSQQMYQALRSLGIDTQLVIYPNENHGISRPSYVRDRMERYLAWYDQICSRRAHARRRRNDGMRDPGCGTRIRIPETGSRSIPPPLSAPCTWGRSRSGDRGTRTSAARSACRWRASRRD